MRLGVANISKCNSIASDWSTTIIPRPSLTSLKGKTWIAICMLVQSLDIQSLDINSVSRHSYYMQP